MSHRIPSPRDRILVLSQDTLKTLVDRRKMLKAAGIGAVAGIGSQYVSLAGSAPRSQSYLRGAQAEELAIIIGTLGDASTINPFRAGDSEDEWRCKILYDEFVRINPTTYVPEPGIAAEWEINDLTFTFTLQPDVMFSDGSPLTAEDIAFTIRGFINSATGSPKQSNFLVIEGAEAYSDGSADDVSGITVVDPGTIQITLSEPNAPFLYNMRYVWPVPMALLEGQDLATTEFFQAPVGAGPYTFESWTTGADFVAVANSNFWETGKPAITRVTHRVIADSQSLVLALQTNEIDGSNYPNPAGQDLLAQNADLDIIAPPFNSGNGWIFNCRDEVLSNKDVRKAIAMATDTQQFADDFLLGLSGPALGPIAPDNWAFDPSLEPIPYDPEGAKALIDGAGVSGAQLTFAVNSGNIFREDWLTVTQQALQQIGIEVIPELVDYATHVEAVTQNQDFQVSGVDFAGVTAEPSELWVQFHSTSSGNYSGLSNPELDTLLEEARATLEQEAAIPIYADIQRIIMDEVPMHFAWYRPFLHTVNKAKFAGYQSSGSFGLFYFLQDWTAAQP
ncbi:MAG: ABC transporter substrate-binding protein [Chloroflexota bacterium]|nr:ABC transporter substrate-binding protein [Chloroflexota bacterium]